MCRKVELFDKRMVPGVVVTQIVPQMVQFQQLHQHQIDMNAFGGGNLRCKISSHSFRLSLATFGSGYNKNLQKIIVILV